MVATFPQPGAVVSTADRLTFTVFLAVAMHAAIILGVTFTREERGASTHTMEVTLAQHRSRDSPDKADFLAQFNQQGSGTLEEKALTTSPSRSEFHDTTIHETNPVPTVTTARQTEQQRKPLVATTASAPVKTVLSNRSFDAPIDAPEDSPNKTLLTRSLEIASLEARLGALQQVHAKRPRIKRLTSLSTRSSADAYYLNSWRRKIETIGNLNYPADARRHKLYGSLRLMVAILPNGRIKEIELLESSGHPSLDDAAIRIVRLASPYAPFPDDLRRTTDVLEIIRTWQFRRNSSLRSF